MLLILFQEGPEAPPVALIPNPRFSRGLVMRQLVTLLPPRRSNQRNDLNG